MRVGRKRQTVCILVRRLCLVVAEGTDEYVSGVEKGIMLHSLIIGSTLLISFCAELSKSAYSQRTLPSFILLFYLHWS